MRAIAAIALLTLSCGSQPTFVERGVPTPGAGFPYGLLAIDVEVGDTRGARVMLARLGYTKRHIDVRRDGVVVVRMIPGEWEVQVVGKQAKSDVVTFGGRKTGDAPVTSGPTAWPDKPLVLQIKRNVLTDAGRICAHGACASAWSESPYERFQAWRDVRRLEVYPGPVAAPASDEPAKAGGADKAADEPPVEGEP